MARMTDFLGKAPPVPAEDEDVVPVPEEEPAAEVPQGDPDELIASIQQQLDQLRASLGG